MATRTFVLPKYNGGNKNMKKQQCGRMQMIITMLAALLIISIAYMSTADAKQTESPAPSDDVNISGPHVVYFNTSGLPPP